MATAPTPTVRVVAGTWEGGATARACAASGCVSNPCRFLYDINGNFVRGAPSPLRLTLQQSRAQVTGTVQLALDSIFFNEGGDLIGVVDEAGALTLSGTVTQTDRSSGTLVQRSEVRVTARTDGAGAALTGDLVHINGTTCVVTMTHSLVSLCRGPSARP